MFFMFFDIEESLFLDFKLQNETINACHCVTTLQNLQKKIKTHFWHYPIAQQYLPFVPNMIQGELNEM